MHQYVQYGAGWSAAEGWLNYDASPTLRFERLPLIGRLYTKNARRFPRAVRYGDIVKGLPLPAGSCRGVYASHVLEHLPRDEFFIALAHTFALLEPGGIFRCIVPDLRERARRYLDSDPSKQPCASDDFMRSTLVGRERRPRGALRLAAAALGHEAHLWMWDAASLAKALDDAGFTGVRPCELGDCADPMFERVEQADRFVDPESGIRECAFEARRP